MGLTTWDATTDMSSDVETEMKAKAKGSDVTRAGVDSRVPVVEHLPEVGQLNFNNFNFYQLMELLLTLTGLDPEDAQWEHQCEVIFRSNPSLGFSPSDVTGLMQREDGRLELETTFLGLSGSQSPLPGYLLEDILTEGENGVRRLFLDFFNNRLISMVYRIWRKYRYYVRFQEGASDKFSAQLFALVGLADPDLRGETPINWCKMLSYAGMLAGRSRSPQVVSGIIAHCFDLEEVDIRQWVSRRVAIRPEQQMKLGLSNMSLGHNTVIGQRVIECNGKFTLVLKGLSQQRYRDFLPTGKEYLPLCKLVEFVLREQMAYDLELHLKHGATSSLVLDKNREIPLGWSSFLGKERHMQAITIQVRQ